MRVRVSACGCLKSGEKSKMSEKKYSVLIADDEYWTREKLRNMIQWEKYGLDFLDPASDGEEALEKVKKYRPDILITDINMPFLNGVELLEKVQEEYPDMITFVISGYDDFEYVKSTFMSGAINYLVKPVTKIDLIKAIDLALRKISGREKDKTEVLKMASILQDREYSQMIQRREMPFVPSFSINNFADLAGMSLMLVKIHNFQGVVRTGGYDMNFLSYQIKQKIRELFEDDDLIVFNNIYRLNEFITVSDKDETEMTRIAEKLRVRLSSLFKCRLTICTSQHSYSMDSIHMAYVEAVGLLMTRKYCSRDEIVLPDREKTSGQNVIVHFSPECEKRLKAALASGRQEKVGKVAFEETGLQDCVRNGWSYLEVKQTVRQIMNTLSEYVLREKGHQKAGNLESYTEALDKTVEMLEFPALQVLLQEAVRSLTPEENETLPDSMKDIVRQAVRWIDEHYSEEISLISLAEKYHVESSYFSKMFRQVTGENLILYITNKRMKKAEEYIGQDDRSLSEIAFLVGYDDYTYFSRVFKKNTGFSPREYRSRTKEGQT